ncbi:MAG: hypothetical protein EA397_16195 [Deltaproteobacteria bacterium]|nr:MAG: hypothetical protein EA397_16195 [Deltaproteobacteria bacterium]
MKHWIRESSGSTDEEVAQITPRLPDAILEGIRHDTASSDEEVEVLLRRLRRQPSGITALGWRAPAFVLAGFLVAAPLGAWVLGASLAPDRLSHDSAPAVEQLSDGWVLLDGLHRVALGPSIQLFGHASLDVSREGPSGAQVALASGVVTFEVDPRGSRRDLRVLAADVQVEVRGTVFTVARSDHRVGVRVERGSVEVTHQGVVHRVEAGGSWTSTDAVALDASDGAAQGRDALVGDGSGGEPEPSEPPEPPRPDSADKVQAPASAPAAVALRDEPEPACEPGALDDACAPPRLPVPPTGDKERFEALARIMDRVGRDPVADRATVEACDRFLSLHPDSSYADDVRAFRVQAAFTGERASQVVRWADAYLARAAADHPRRGEVERWRSVAKLRIDAIDSAQKGGCDDALPLLRELVPLEDGTRHHEALAWLGLCSHATGNLDEARRALRQVREETLAAGLRARVREIAFEIR